MQCAISVRRLKPGAYDEFRRAMEPILWPEALAHIEVLRNNEDPDQVVTIGYFDTSFEGLESLRDDPRLIDAETKRIARLSEFVDEVLVNGIFDLADDLRPSA